MKKHFQDLLNTDVADRLLLYIAVFFCLSLLPAVTYSQPTTISVCTLSQNRANYDLKPLWVAGIVSTIKNRKPPSGNRYTIVQVKDTQGQCWVRLFFRHPQNFLQTGQEIEVFGRYFKKFRYFRWTYEHEIQPTEFKENGDLWFLTQYRWAKQP